MEAEWSAKRVANQLSHSDLIVLGGVGISESERCHLHEDHAQDAFDRLVVKKTPHRTPESPRNIGRRLAVCALDAHPSTSPFGGAAHEETGLQWKGTNVFNDESKFNFSSDDNRVRVWKAHGERLNPAFALQQHTHSHSWCDGMGCKCLQYTVTPSIDPWHHYSPVVCPCHPATTCVATHATAPRSHFFQKRQWLASHGKGSQDCFSIVTSHPWPARSLDLSSIEHIWDHLGWRVGHPMSLNELVARLQQIWNEMSQDIIQNLYASMPDRIASCIRARGSSIG
ncbi:uncharacterized protein TNCV_2204861 [Trichonephila clavipes]|nr:uncharacterized protein TNCV_2204861 [Trichonephila clavipes]